MHFTTSRLIIRELVEDDADDILALLNSAGFIANIGDRGIRTREQALQIMSDKYCIAYPRYGLFALARADDGQWLGTVSYLRRDFLDVDDVGYALLPAYEGMGYAREATAGLLDWASNEGQVAVAAIVNEDNERSRKLLEKLGFTQRGTVLMDGEETPVLNYGLALQ